MDFRNPVQALVPGVTGRLLQVMVGTDRELSLRALARLAGVSPAQASRVLGRLVTLGLAERRDEPPVSLFRLVESHVGTKAIMALADARRSVISDMAASAAELDPQPVNLTLFGSLAAGTAGPESDIDVLVVRPDEIHEDDDAWTDSLTAWWAGCRRLSGNEVKMIELPEAEARRMLRSKKPLWREIRDSGICLAGTELDALVRAHA